MRAQLSVLLVNHVVPDVDHQIRITSYGVAPRAFL